MTGPGKDETNAIWIVRRGEQAKGVRWTKGTHGKLQWMKGTFEVELKVVRLLEVKQEPRK